MCEICRQVRCPSGCPNAPLWEPPKCYFCGDEAKWELEGLPVCNACLIDQSTTDADFGDMISFVSENRNQWHNFLDFLIDTGALSANSLRGTNFNFPREVAEFCGGSDEFFDFLDYNIKVDYKALE